MSLLNKKGNIKGVKVYTDGGETRATGWLTANGEFILQFVVGSEIVEVEISKKALKNIVDTSGLQEIASEFFID